MLKTITPQLIKSYTKQETLLLCEQLRTTIYDTVMHCGGHLSSNLGAIESTVALFKVFDFPKDKIVFDVGHQCYAYKLLSGRANTFSTLRKLGGISGFPKREESVYDSYDTGHAGTSISAAIGLAKARDLQQQDHAVIAYIGDGSFNNGLVYEALCSLKIMQTKVLIILNDNDMSISPTVGGMHDILSDIKNKQKSDNVKLLEQFGLQYLGVADGNDVEEMETSLLHAKDLLKNGSVLLHIATRKGKGYEFCEEDPTGTHGVSPLGAVKDTEYSHVLGETLCEMAQNNDKIAVVSAAMKEALGLSQFFERYPNRAFDVGICEENAAVLCASMAAGGLKPYYTIYSTFLQRAFDEIIHDVCAQDMPVTFCIDRAGISGPDGETHQGVFDLSYLSMIPNLTIAVPKDTNEFAEMLRMSATYAHPLAIRYPRAGCVQFESTNTPLQAGKWEYLHKVTPEKDAPVTVIASGERCLSMAARILRNLEKQGKTFDLVNARFVKPLDFALLANVQSKHIITMEDNAYLGGLGLMISGEMMRLQKQCSVKNFAYKDIFIPHGKVGELQEQYGMNAVEIQEYIDKCL